MAQVKEQLLIKSMDYEDLNNSLVKLLKEEPSGINVGI